MTDESFWNGFHELPLHMIEPIILCLNDYLLLKTLIELSPKCQQVKQQCPVVRDHLRCLPRFPTAWGGHDPPQELIDHLVIVYSSGYAEGYINPRLYQEYSHIPRKLFQSLKHQAHLGKLFSELYRAYHDLQIPYHIRHYTDIFPDGPDYGPAYQEAVNLIDEYYQYLQDHYPKLKRLFQILTDRWAMPYWKIHFTSDSSQENPNIYLPDSVIVYIRSQIKKVSCLMDRVENYFLLR